LPPETPAILDKIYSFDLQGAVEDAKRLNRNGPDHRSAILLEAEALWWAHLVYFGAFQVWNEHARRRPKLAADQHYFELSAKALSLAEAQIKQNDSAEMQFYAGMAEASARDSTDFAPRIGTTARSGVRAASTFVRAKALDPGLADVDLGLGLYNYYVDTLSSLARILRFFMGIPGGSKQEGIRLLEQAAAQGVLTSNIARFYLALNLHRYDQQYEKALGVLVPLVKSTRQIRSLTGARRPVRQTWSKQQALPAIAPQARPAVQNVSVNPIYGSVCAHPLQHSPAITRLDSLPRTEWPRHARLTSSRSRW